MTLSADTRPNDLLLLAGKVIAVFMQIVMGIAAAGLAIAAVVFTVFRSQVAAELASEMGAQGRDFPFNSAVSVMLLALAAVALLFVFFGKLRKIIATVGEGDPFAPDNADRLSAMAFLMLGVQLLMLPTAAIGMALTDWADEVESANVSIDAGLDLTGILLVVILFILARVFRHGAAMREDLEGTV